MRNIACFCILLLISEKALADLPPSNDSFKVSTATQEWSAFVYPESSQKTSVEQTWSLAIYKGKFHPSKQPVWQSTFFHTGYSGGYLSEDGKIFVVVSQWYLHNQPTVYIYTQDCVTTVIGADLGINEEQLVKTASHQLWLKNLKVDFLLTNDDAKIRIYTVSGERYISENCGNVT